MKNLQTFSVIAFLSLLLFNCGNTDSSRDSNSLSMQTNQSNKIDTVEIISRLKKGEKAYLYYVDNFEDLIFPIEFTDTLKVKIAFKDFLLLKDTEKQINFPISTSEKLYVSKNKSNTTILTSDNEARSKELALMVSLIEHHQSFFYQPEINYENVNKELHLANLQNPVSPTYLKSVEKIVFMRYLSNLITAFLVRPKLSKAISDSIEKQKSAFHNESYLQNSDYKWALVGYSKFLARKTLNTPNEFKSLMDSVNTNFTGKIKDFLQFYHLNNGKTQHPMFNDYLQTYLKTSSSGEYISYLTEKYLSTPTIIKGELISDKNESIDYAGLMNQHKGKLVYIDFWASWCMPCRKEIPASKELMKNYKDRAIQYVTISMDENKVSWKKAIEAEGLKEIFNYQLRTNFESTLAKQFKIQTIPRYILIGKDGKVINADAPRPSDPKIRQIFDEMLKK